MKVDLVMWTKNGEKTLSSVLNRISQVIPPEKVGNRIIVDDHSVDRTRSIAAMFGWKVVDNEGTGISDAANTALKLVKTEYFASFEQDVLLSFDWWKNIVPLLKEKDVIVASGVRLPSLSLVLFKINEYSLEKARRLGFPYFKTLDNTIYKTALIKGLGGFPKTRMIVDTVLAKQIKDANLKWAIDPDTVSLHLKSFLGEVRSQYFYGKFRRELAQLTGEQNMLGKTVASVAFSVIRGVDVAWEKKCWRIIFVYPVLRLALLLGVLGSFL